MVEKQVDKLLYKLELYLIKIIPLLLAICYFINTILSYFNIDTIIPSLIGGVSLLPLLFLYISSYTFKFCTYHRLSLHYILIIDIINYYDYSVGLNVTSKVYVMLHSMLFLILIILIIYFKFYNEKLHTKMYNKVS